MLERQVIKVPEEKKITWLLYYKISVTITENEEFPNHYKKTKLAAYLDLKIFKLLIHLFIFQTSK